MVSHHTDRHTTLYTVSAEWSLSGHQETKSPSLPACPGQCLFLDSRWHHSDTSPFLLLIPAIIIISVHAQLIYLITLLTINIRKISCWLDRIQYSIAYTISKWCIEWRKMRIRPAVNSILCFCQFIPVMMLLLFSPFLHSTGPGTDEKEIQILT